MALEAAVPARELHRRLAQLSGQRVRGLVGHLLGGGLVAHAHHDPGRAAAQRGDIRRVVADDRDKAPGEQVQVGAGPGHRLGGLRRRLALGRPRPIAEPHARRELLQRREDAIAAVGLTDVLVQRVPLRRVRQEFGDRRLVRDQRAHPVRVPRDEIQAVRRAAARAQHVGRPGTHRVQQAARVVREYPDGQVIPRSLHQASRIAPAVIRHDRVLVGQALGDRREPARVHGPAGDHQQHRPGSAHLVVQLCARNRQHVRLHGSSVSGD